MRIAVQKPVARIGWYEMNLSGLFFFAHGNIGPADDWYAVRLQTIKPFTTVVVYNHKACNCNAFER